MNVHVDKKLSFYYSGMPNNTLHPSILDRFIQSWVRAATVSEEMTRLPWSQTGPRVISRSAERCSPASVTWGFPRLLNKYFSLTTRVY